jgi:hypothetical protein
VQDSTLNYNDKSGYGVEEFLMWRLKAKTHAGALVESVLSHTLNRSSEGIGSVSDNFI